MTPRLLIFGGTTEARQILERGVPALCSVATASGAQLLTGLEKAETTVGRLDAAAMADLIRRRGITHVADATHPYAAEVTKNIREACAETGTPLVRVARGKTPIPDGVTVVSTPAEAAELLNQRSGKVLLTVGSKELACFAGIRDGRERLYARVLPLPDVIEQCARLGFDAGHLIAMQGPFSAAMNEMMLDMTGASIIVTKDGGAAGGMEEKLEAARRKGAEVILIGRPGESGLSVEEALLWIRRELGLPRPPLFPLLISLEGKRALVIGGGPVALRRAMTLKSCGAVIEAISPEFCEGFGGEGFVLTRRGWKPEDLPSAALIVAATDQREENHKIALEAKRLHILVSVADAAGECSFFFPALVACGEAAVSVSTAGLSPALTRRLADRLRDLLPQLVEQERRKL